MMASKGEAAADPLLFSLVDLILACLRSQNNQTVYVTLQLVSVILKRHHRYAVITLLYTEGVLAESHHRTSGAHQQEVEYLMSLAGTIGGQDNFDEIYNNILKDTLVRLENHPCSIKLVTPKTSTNNRELPAIPDSLPGAPRDVRPHTLHPSDPLLNIVLDRLENFFLNPVDMNLSLTEAVFDLAACGFMHLEGWFLRTPQNYVYEEEDDGPPLPEPPLDPESQEYTEYKQMQSMLESRRRPRWIQSSLPRLLNLLQTLIGQVEAYRETIPRFDDLLQQRREAFQIADCAEPPPKRPPTRTPTPQTSGTSSTPYLERPFFDEGRNASRERPSGLEGFAQRILSELGTPSRSGSPRGRKDVKRGEQSSSPVPDTPLRGGPGGPGPNNPGPGGARSYPPGAPQQQQQPPWETHNYTVAKEDAFTSQARAFQAIDQSILARRVGIPKITKSKVSEEEVKPIPLSFDRQRTATGEPDAEQEEEEAKAEEGGGEDALLAPSEDGQDGDGDADGDDGEGKEDGRGHTASVSHVLTNVIILQSFLFELASLVQVRAGLFDEVRFT
jgi:hypothetical protein